MIATLTNGLLDLPLGAAAGLIAGVVTMWWLGWVRGGAGPAVVPRPDE